jgi:general secretion pathway protein G
LFQECPRNRFYARVTAARTQITSFKTALASFEVDNGYFPRGQAGLQDLLVQPRDAQGWKGPYIEEIPLDPWQHAYLYECPSKRNTSSFDIVSMGPDGRVGTEDDITNWSQPLPK